MKKLVVALTILSILLGMSAALGIVAAYGWSEEAAAQSERADGCAQAAGALTMAGYWAVEGNEGKTERFVKLAIATKCEPVMP